MSDADKRTVATDAIATLGTIIGPNEKRDAIHLAVIPAIAGEMMNAGDHVLIRANLAWKAKAGKGVGIVDPFLVTRHPYGEHVRAHERFWLVIYPRQINSLRHVWTHPAFPDEPDEPTAAPRSKEASEQWLRAFCANHPNCPDLEDLLAAIRGDPDAEYGTRGTLEGDYLTVYGSDAGGAIPPEFWDHAETVTGLRNLPRAKYFSCSC